MSAYARPVRSTTKAEDRAAAGGPDTAAQRAEFDRKAREAAEATARDRGSR